VSSRLAVLRRRDFRLLLSGQAVSVFGDRMVSVALAFAVLEVGGSASAVGLVLAARTLPMVASVLIGGVVADRASRRAVMVGADLIRLTTQGAMAALLIAGSAEVWMLASLAGATGLATGFFNPASTGLLPEIVPAEQLQPANAVRATAVSVGEILGPLVAGLLVAAAGAGWAVAVDSTTFLVSAVCLTMLRMPQARQREAATTFVSDLREGWVAFRSRRWVWTFVVYFAIGNTFWGAWTSLGPVVAEQDLGGAAAWGSVLAAFGVGALSGSVMATWARPSRPLLLVLLGEGLFALPLAFLAAATPLALLAVGTYLSGVGMMLGMSVWESTLQRHIPAQWLSRVTSYDWFGSFAFYPLGLALWGPIAAVIGISTALWVAFALFIASILTLLTVRDVRRLPAAPDAETTGRTIPELAPPL
jgi:MFS family permease